MKKIGWSVVALIAVVLGLVVNSLYFRPLSFRVFLDRVAITDIWDSPETLSEMRMIERFGMRSHNAQLDDVSDAHATKQFANAKENLATLTAYDRDSLSAAQQISYDTLHYGLTERLAGERFRYHNFPVEQMSGDQINLPNFLANNHQVNDATDADYYIARLRRIPARLAQVRAALAFRQQRGIIAPHFALAKSVAGMREFVALPAEQNMLYVTFQTKLVAVKSLSADSQTQYLKQARAAIQDEVYPAYQQLIAATDALAQQQPRDDGAWSLPDGDAYYAYLLKSHTTTDLTPDQVHQLGLSEVARIEAEMQAILRTVGEPSENVGAAMKRLTNDPRFLYPNSAAGRQQLIKGYKAILAEVQAALPKAFGHIPAAKLDVRPVPAVSEKTAAGAYYEAPALDGSRPGVFYANLYDMATTPKFGMRTLSYHEGVPGHHLQNAIAREQTDLPLFRRFIWYSAFGEGWALYAEKLADEMGLEPNPYDKLGRLRDELFRAARMVVDTGMHAKHWSREQAVRYMEDHTGMNHGDVVIEIERYLVWPGQACAYKIGMIKLLELREHAKAKLGKSFDLHRFHDLLLRNGALPLSVLEKLVDEWIAAGGVA